MIIKVDDAHQEEKYREQQALLQYSSSSQLSPMPISAFGRFRPLLIDRQELLGRMLPQILHRQADLSSVASSLE